MSLQMDVVFCATPYWDGNVTWYTEDPDFTDCFQKTVLVWIPCALLWLLFPVQLFNIRHRKTTETNRGTFLFWLKVTLGIILIGTNVSELAYASYGIAVYGSEPMGYDVVPFQYADINASLALILTLALYLAYATMDRRKRRQSNGILFLFWIFMGIMEGISFRTQIKKFQELGAVTKTEQFHLIIQFIQCVAIMIQLMVSPMSWATCHFEKCHSEESPETHSSFLNQLMFWWYNRIVYRGWKTVYTVDNLWVLNPGEKARNVSKIFAKKWNQYAGRSRLGMVLVKAFWVQLLCSCVLKLIYNAMLFSIPELLRLLIGFVKHPEAHLWKGYFYALLFLTASMIQTFAIGHYFHHCNILGLRIRTALMTAVYRKVLRTGGLADTSGQLGQATTLMAVDAQRIMDLSSFINQLWEVPLQIGISIYLLHHVLGASAFAGLGVMVLSIPLEAGIAVWSKRQQMRQMTAKDARVRLTGEVFRTIKLLKLYAWEDVYEQRIFKHRKDELKALRTIGYLQAFSTFYSILSPFIVALATFATYVLSDPRHVLDSEEAFVALSVFNILKNPMNMLPPTVGNVVQAMVSKKRLSKALNSEEPKPYVIKDQTDNTNSAAVIANGTFAWSDEPKSRCLTDVNLVLPAGKLIGIVGQAGSGKTALCRALLGSMNRMSGTVSLAGNVAYMPQQSWLQSRSFKDNILFGRPFQKTAYQTVVQCCALEDDLNAFPLHDDTELADQGSTLSGGQKQRLCLARTIYGHADVFILDDPFSALDAKVSKEVFEHVVGPMGLLGQKTRVVVMNGYRFLPYCDLLVVMEKGRVLETGTFADLLQQDGPFSEFLQTHLRSEIEAIHTSDPHEADHRQQAFDEVVEKLPRNIKASLREHKRSVIAIQRPGRRRSSVISRVDSLEDLHGRLKQLHNSETDPRLRLHGLESQGVKKTSWRVYWQFMRTVTLRISVLILVTNAIATAFSVAAGVWLSEWAEDKNITFANGKVDMATRNMRLGVYATLGGLQGLFFFASMLFLAFGLTLASKILHNRMLQCLIRAPMWFFDTTPLGRITNRFSKDVDTVDVNVPQSLRQCLNSMFNILGILAILIYSYPLFSAFMVPIAVIYFILQFFYITTSRQLKQLEAVSRSPFFSHFQETLSGAGIICIFRQQERFLKEFEDALDINNGVAYLSLVAQRWLSLRLELIGNLIVFLTAILAVYGRDHWEIHPGIVGLSVTYAVQITQVLSWFVQKVSDLEMSFISVERVKEYTKCPQEAAWVIPDNRPPANWPTAGSLQFSHYKCRYRPGLELALKGISCDISPKEKIGIVGRTGAGKSSLSLGIFRIIEAGEGSIHIDGVDISKIGLHDLRSKLTIIPQDPLLLSGSLRENLDPSEKYSDEDIWNALEVAHLKPYVKCLSGGIMHPMSEGGGNMSSGQRQLVCLARAILRKTKILVMDEATASLDAETDELLQKTIHNAFEDCTVLIIAHRLQSVLDCNRVMVLDHGEIEEFDHPSVLLRNPDSAFYGLAADANVLNSVDLLGGVTEQSTPSDTASDSSRRSVETKSISDSTVDADTKDR